MQVSTREPDARGPVSVLVPPDEISLRSPAYNHDLKTIKQVDGFACSQRTSWQTWFGQNCSKLCPGRKDTLRKLGWSMWMVWEFCRVITLL